MRLAKGGFLLLAFAGLASCHSLQNVWVEQLTLAAPYSYPVMLSTVADSRNLTNYDFESGWASTSFCYSARTGNQSYTRTSSSFPRNIGEPLFQQIFVGITPAPDSPKPDWIQLSSVRIRAMLDDLFWIIDSESYSIQVEVAAPTSASEK